MSALLLVLRVSRRAIAAAVLRDDDLSFFDGRHLTSNRARAIAGAARYVTRLLDTTMATRVAIEAAVTEGSQTVAVLEQLKTVFAERKISAIAVAIEDVLRAFGMPALRTRRELRELASRLFPQCSQIQSQVRSYLLDAAAAALFAESQTALGLLPT
jgi:hypothetical protein